MLLYLFVLFFFFFKQKTAYEMRISDWSSDVCSSDLGNDDYVIFGALAFVDCHRIGEIEITPIGSVDKDILFANLDQQGGIVLEIDFAAHHCADVRSEEHTSELQSLMSISYAVFCLKKKNKHSTT